MVKIDQLTKQEHPDTQALDLCSTHTDKIRKIEGLQRFRNLRSLNLSNNMIAKIQNLSSLAQLRSLKLDFNQITTIQGLKTLDLLEELSLSYNRIASVPEQIKCNQKLKVLHIAYNDIKSIQDIKHLSQLPYLSILSLAGNPFLNALNYVAFIKMLVPSLLILDSRDASQSIINTNVHPHQQIFILRDALNKLIDQRNSMMQPQLSQENSSPIQQRQTPQVSQQQPHHMEHKHSFGKTVSFAQNQREKVMEILQEWIEANSAKLEVKKMQISQISNAFSKKVNTTLKNQLEDHYQYLQQKINKYHESERKGKLSTERKLKLEKMEKQLKKVESFEQQKREQSRQILQTIKSKELQYSKLKQKSHLLRSLQQKIRQSPSQDPHKLFISQILFGQLSYDLNYKDIKKYLFYPKGLIHIIKNLNLIIFGELADYQRIEKLKEFLEQRSLIEIINNLKEMGLNYKKEMKKMQKEKAKIVQKLQTQALQLCDQWKQIQREKRNLKRSRQVSESASKVPYDDKFQRIELEERDRILQLKKEKEHYETKVQQLKKSTESLQIEFERKYKQLEEFQKFFEQFKSDKEIAEGLKNQLEQTQREINNKQQILMQIDQNVKELTLKEQNLQERAAHYERKAFEKAEQTAHYDQKLRALNEKLRRATEEINSKSFELVRIQQQFTKLIEENRDYEKKIERHKHTYELYEEKLKNLNELQASKKNTLASIENEIEVEKKILKDLKQKVEQSQQKLNRNMEVSYQYQLKIQEGKKSIESLSDINRTLSDMMERQNQLKRSNLELQLENQHLFELKGKLLEQIKVKYDDQDQNL